MAPNPNMQRLHDAGTSIWLDTFGSTLLSSRRFTRQDP
jgi:hypothetical protein